MKICIINLEYFENCGGAGIVTKNLGQALSSLGHEVHIVRVTKDKSNQTITNNGIHCHTLSSKKGIKNRLRYFVEIYSTIKKIDPDILHAQDLYPTFFCYIYKLYHKTPYCVCYHCDPKLYATDIISKLALVLGRYFLPVQKANAIISVARHLNTDIKEHYKRNAIFIPNGANITQFTPNQQKIDNRSTCPTIICVSRMIHDKGLEDAIVSFKQIVSSYPNARMLLVGDGELRDVLKALSVSLSLENNIIFTGFVPNSQIINYYHQADLFLLPSWNEGFPIVLFEAMGCGLPIISTNVGCISEIINEENGIIIPIKDPEKMADAMNAIIALPPDEYKRMSLRNSAIAKQHGWENSAREYEKVYEKIMGNRYYN